MKSYWGIYAILFSIFVSNSLCQYTADWSSLDSRPLPAWYDEAKIGIFIHWGVFSVPSFGSEWFWQNWKGYNDASYISFMDDNYPPDFTYQDFGPQFTAEFYSPNDWADLFQESGAKYVVLTSKHHEGYTLWPSKYSFSWNAMDIGPARDILGDLADAIRGRTNLHFGLYHSLYEWFNPLYLEDKANNFNTNDFVSFKTMPELYEITNAYQPEVIWSDGEWEASDTYWNSTEYLAWLFNESPVKDTVVVNDRWGSETLCTHGSFYTCTDRYNPGVLQPFKWENAMTLDSQSWGYRRNAKYEDYLTIEDLLSTLAGTVSCGGNLLVNVGPTKEGTIVPIMEERLKQMGEWLTVNGDSIYSSKPWLYQNDTTNSDVWYTQNNSSVYAISLTWPSDGILVLGSVTTGIFNGQSVTAELLGNPNIPITELTYSSTQTTITLPNKSEINTEWAWVFKLENLQIVDYS